MLAGSRVQAEDGASKPTEQKKELYRKLEELLTGARLKGKFTILGSEVTHEDEYVIERAEKVEADEMWAITAKIKYGDKEFALPPIPIEIQWAGDTPVITLTKVSFPGMGTFGARVCIYDGMYAGTWRHDDVVGHMFGVIEKEKVEK